MRPFSILVLLVVLSLSSGLGAQQPQDSPTAEPNPADTADGRSNVDTDLAAEVRQLRQEVDQLRRELTLLQSELDQVRGEHAVAEVANQSALPEPEQKSSAPAAPVGSTKSSRSTASHAQPSPAPAASAAPEADDKAPTTVIVFRDGHRTEVKNYAIIGQTLWVYTEDDSKKIPLSEVDLTATKNANSERGITFQLPPAP
jgi:TolA-binding protein